MIIRLLSLGCSLFLLMGLSACGGETEGMRETAHKYLQARMNGDFVQANDYVSASSKTILSELAELSEDIWSADTIAFPYTIVRATENGNQGTVTYLLAGFGEEELNMVQNHGIWEVVLTSHSIPDASLLLLELMSLEQEDSSELGKDALDNLLLQEDLADAWEDSSDI